MIEAPSLSWVSSALTSAISEYAETSSERAKPPREVSYTLPARSSLFAYAMQWTRTSRLPNDRRLPARRASESSLDASHSKTRRAAEFGREFLDGRP